MKKCLIVIVMLFLFLLSGCGSKTSPINNPKTRNNYIKYHPEFLEQIELVKDKVNNDFLEYLNTSKYKSIYSNDYLIFSRFAIYQPDHFANSLHADIYGNDNLFSGDWYVLYKRPNKNCWTGRRFILEGSVQGDLYPLEDDDINSLLKDNDLKFNGDYFFYKEDKNGYNDNFDILNYKKTTGYVNEPKSTIMRDYEAELTTYYWDWIYYGVTDPTLVKSSS